MINRFVSLLAVFCGTCLLAPLASAQITTVPSVDVHQYLGTWYQAAHNPMVFEGECACAQQKLGATATPGMISVFNSCNDKTPTGPIRSISGTATSDDPVSNSKFTVDFGLPKKGEYWIIGVEARYRYAVVTDSRGQSLYILSKTPTLDSALYADAVALAAKQVDVTKLVLTNQDYCTYP